MTEEPIYRLMPTRFEIADNRRVTFYAAVFDQPTTITETVNGKVVKYKEVFRLGAFADSLQKKNPIRATINHQAKQTFAKTEDGSLIAQEDPKGFFNSCWLPENDIGELAKRGIESGDIVSASVGFIPIESNVLPDGTIERVKVKVFDVCLALNQPAAYPGTEVHLRTDQQLMDLFRRLRILKLKI